jgi:hypothetical protein
MNFPPDTLLSPAPNSLVSTADRIRRAQEQTLGFTRTPTTAKAAGGVSLSTQECPTPGCHRTFSVERSGRIPRHRAGTNPFSRGGAPTAPVCRGSDLIILQE